MNEVDINRAYAGGNTVLHIAAATKNTRLVSRLLEHPDIIVTKINDHGDTPLHIACKESSREVVELLLNAAPRAITIRNEKGYTPLHAAAQGNHPEVVLYILNHPITNGHYRNPINCRTTEQEYTMLHIACIHGNTDIILDLIEQGADIYCVDQSGYMPLHCATQRGFGDIVSLLLQSGYQSDIRGGRYNQTALHIAATYSRLDILRSLLVYNHDQINFVDLDDESALHIAVKSNNVDIVEFLLNQNAEIALQNTNGDTALHLACAEGVLEVLEPFLMRENAETVLNLRNNQRKSAFHLACENGHENIVTYFLNRYDSVIHETYEDGKNSLHLICEYGRLNVLTAVIEDRNLTPIELQCRDDLRRTPMHWGALYGHTNILNFLIKKGVDANLRDRYGDTPLHLACLGGYVEVLCLFLQEQINISPLNNHGHTPFDLAIKHGHYDIVDKFLCNFNLHERHFYLPSIAGYEKVLRHLATEQRNILNDIFLDVFYAVTDKGRLDVVNYLLSVENINNVTYENRKTPLHIAAEKGNYLTCELLLRECGDDFVNHQDENGNTPLHLAVSSYSKETVTLLSRSGALEDIKNHSGRSALELADDLGFEILWP